MVEDDDGLFPAERSGERRCGGCGEIRPLAMFYVAAEQRASEKRGSPKRAVCRVCQRTKNTQRRAPRYEIAARIKIEAGCADCGLHSAEHPEIFDFDHRPGTEKIAGVSTFLTKGTIEDMLAEIAKCDVVCGNCHRIRTHRQREPVSFGRDRGPEKGRRTRGD